MSARVLLVMALVAPLAGCSLLQGEGEEVLVLRNDDVQPVTMSVTVSQDVGGIELFRQNVALQRGQAREFPLPMKPGSHTANLATSTSVFETFIFQIPEKGDSEIEIEVHRGGATITTRETG